MIISAHEAKQIADKNANIALHRKNIMETIKLAAENGFYYCSYSSEEKLPEKSLSKWLMDLGYHHCYISHEGTRIHMCWD